MSEPSCAAKIFPERGQLCPRVPAAPMSAGNAISPTPTAIVPVARMAAVPMTIAGPSHKFSMLLWGLRNTRVLASLFTLPGVVQAGVPLS